MDVLGKLFGSTDRVKVMRLFVLNPDATFDRPTIAKRSKISTVSARRETTLLSQVGFLSSKRGSGWKLNHDFFFIQQLRGLFKIDILTRQKEITDRFVGCGQIKLLVASGLFIQADNSRADLLIVGSKLKRSVIERAIKATEAEVGRELVYAVFETDDFLYRLNAYDKFLRDILDYPHEKVINRLGLE